MDYIVHGILQARILEWVAVPFSRVSSQPRDWTQVSGTAAEFISWATRETRFHSWVGKIPWRWDRWPTPVSWASLVAQLVKTPPALRETWVGKIPWKGEKEPTCQSKSPKRRRCSCLENPTDRVAWWSTAHGFTKSGTQRKHTTAGSFTNCLFCIPSLIFFPN